MSEIFQIIKICVPLCSNPLTPELGLLKQMYSLSLNQQSVPRATHLLAATSALLPLLRQIPIRR